MDDFQKAVLLYDLYGNFLTERQQNVMDMHLNYDLNLSEIAENLNISRQGVHDLYKRSYKILLDIDKKLNLLARIDNNEVNKLEAIAQKLSTGKINSTQQKETAEELTEIIKDLKKSLLIETTEE